MFGDAVTGVGHVFAGGGAGADFGDPIQPGGGEGGEEVRGAFILRRQGGFDALEVGGEGEGDGGIDIAIVAPEGFEEVEFHGAVSSRTRRKPRLSQRTEAGAQSRQEQRRTRGR